MTKSTKKNILIINTGGTISSQETPNGFVPKENYIKTCLKTDKDFHHPDIPDFDILEYSPLIDSANIQYQDWNKLGLDIEKNYDNYDGFIILHGTDTLAYTASALSFMLESLGKPVIITGSQRPFSVIRNDARLNLLGALLISGHFDIPEVCVYFNNRLFRGNRTQKISAHQFNAFSSPNYPNLAKAGIEINIHQEHILKKPIQKFNLQKINSHYIANFRLFPGASTKILKNILTNPLEGLILETYGIGNAPNTDSDFLALLNQAKENNIIIINVSQCQQAMVDMNNYATGKSLAQCGVVSGYDMTPETAHVKLLYLLSKEYDLETIKSKLQQSLTGEISSPSC